MRSSMPIIKIKTKKSKKKLKKKEMIKVLMQTNTLAKKLKTAEQAHPFFMNGTNPLFMSGTNRR